MPLIVASDVSRANDVPPASTVQVVGYEVAVPISNPRFWDLPGPPLFTTSAPKPAFAWVSDFTPAEKFVESVTCIAGADPDNMKPIELTTQPQGSSDTPDGRSSGQRLSPSSSHRLDRFSSGVAYTSQVNQCLANVKNQGHEKN